MDEVLELTAGFLSSEHVIAIDGPETTVTLQRADCRLMPSAAGLCRYTTPELVATEQRLLERAVMRRHEHTGVVSPVFIDRALTSRPTISAEQAAVVRSVCSTGAGVEIVEGVAGAGKTFALAAARDAWTADGFNVMGCALAAKAAARLHDATRISSVSIDRLLVALDQQRITLESADVVVVDEAAMVGSRKLHRLLDHAERARAKVVLIGDPCQLPEIEAGGAFCALTRTLGASGLDENRRQTEPWERHALAQLRAGDIEPALDAYLAHDRIVTGDGVRARLVTDWLAAHTEGTDAVMLAATTVEVDDLNRRARRHLQTHGMIGADQFIIDGRGFAVGDHVLALRNDYHRGVLNGTRLRVTGIEARHRLLATVDDHDRPVTLDVAYLEAGHLTHGYAMTIHKAQGATVERAFVLAPDILTAETGYTALSRARERTDIYLETTPRFDRESHGPPTQTGSPEDRLVRSLQQRRREAFATDQAGLTRLPVHALHAERVQLERRLGPRPPDRRRELERVAAEISQLRYQYEAAASRAERATRELDRFGPIARRRHPARVRAIETRRAAAASEMDSLQPRLAGLSSEHRTLSNEQRRYKRWTAEHAPELGHAQELERSIRIVEALHQGPVPERAYGAEIVHGPEIDLP